MSGEVLPDEMDDGRRIVAFEDLQEAVLEWQRRRWPADHLQPLITVLKAAKVGEEAGEVCEAVEQYLSASLAANRFSAAIGRVLGNTIKHHEHRRTLDEVKGEVGDAYITLAGLCAELGIDGTECAMDRWNEDVRFRGRGYAITEPES